MENLEKNLKTSLQPFWLWICGNSGMELLIYFPKNKGPELTQFPQQQWLQINLQFFVSFL